MAQEFHAYDGGTWRKAQRLYVFDGGTWRELKSAHVYDGTQWRTVFGALSLTAASGAIITVGQWNCSYTLNGVAPVGWKLKFTWTAFGLDVDAQNVDGTSSGTLTVYLDETQEYRVILIDDFGNEVGTPFTFTPL